MIITGKKFSKPALSRVINGDVALKIQKENPHKIRLDRQLTELYPEYNRSSLQQFIRSGFVKVNNQVVEKPNTKILVSDKIDLTLPPSITLPPPEIIYQDENVLVLNKPSGLLSIKKGQYSAEPTLEDYGLIVHRLDRDTSGVVILAKNPETQKFLRKQFQDRKVKKTYYAITIKSPKLSEALIDLPILRNLKRPATFEVNPQGKPSKTHYRIIKVSESKPLALLELKPTTGRTHQLRVHLNYLGTPILGDQVYGLKFQAKHKAKRLFLHAESLEITIPKGQRKVFRSPLPPEFMDVL